MSDFSLPEILWEMVMRRLLPAARFGIRWEIGAGIKIHSSRHLLLSKWWPEVRVIVTSSRTVTWFSGIADFLPHAQHAHCYSHRQTRSDYNSLTVESYCNSYRSILNTELPMCDQTIETNELRRLLVTPILKVCCTMRYKYPCLFNSPW